MNSTPHPPLSVLGHYSSHPDSVTVKPLTGGEVNYSWVITNDTGSRYVLQRISPIFERAMIEDAARITNQLEVMGWEMPTTLVANDGNYSINEVTSTGTWLWRATKYIDSDQHVPHPSVKLCYEYGDILARLHTSLKNIDYTPIFSLPHFHDTDYHLGHLLTLTDRMPDDESRTLAYHTTTAYQALPKLPPSPPQLIHADPRTDNMLFRNSQPLTYIDWDTAMLGNIWVDIGDRLRSFAEDYLKQTTTLPSLELLSTFSEGYRKAASNTTQPEYFLQYCITSACRISLELTARYLNDIVDDNYWVWDRQRFSSRRDSNLHRANTSWKVYSHFHAHVRKEAHL